MKSPEPCPWIANIPAYVPGRSKEDIAHSYGVSSPVKLTSNENPLGPSPKAAEAAREALTDAHLYPDPDARALREAASRHFGCPAESIIAGNGSDEIIDLVCRAYLRPGDTVVVPACTFSYYTIAALSCGATVRTAAMKGNHIDPRALLACAGPETRIVFVANPNNPTGTYLAKDDVLGLIEGVPEGCIVLVDEAYASFARRDDFMSCTALVAVYPHLVCVHTLSKSHGLAGVRVGFGVMPPAIRENVMRIKQPFNVNILAQKAGVAALEDRDFLKRTLETTWEAIDTLYAEFDRLGLVYEPSQTNFVMVHIGPQAHRIYEDLLRRGFITRWMASFGLPEHIRVSAGTPEEIRAFVKAMEEVL